MSSTRPAARNRRVPRLAFEVQYAVRPPGLPSRALLRRWARAALMQDAQVTVRFVGKREGLRLNRAYRGKAHATNVLTFRYGEGKITSGDIAICVPVVEREARAQHKSKQAHFAHLLVHGMLHLQGFDHEQRADAELMEGIESEIVGNLGYRDPYRPADATSNVAPSRSGFSRRARGRRRLPALVIAASHGRSQH
jgi:probable rRNA maturation factor